MLAAWLSLLRAGLHIDAFLWFALGNVDLSHVQLHCKLQLLSLTGDLLGR